MTSSVVWLYSSEVLVATEPDGRISDGLFEGQILGDVLAANFHPKPLLLPPCPVDRKQC
jgi:hypothetical protein